jgi:hypothetical protein
VITVRIAHAEPGPGGPWTQHEITARVPGDTDAVVLGIFLAGGGRIELRQPELTRRD